jgi:hypothetical protein
LAWEAGWVSRRCGVRPVQLRLSRRWGFD